MNLLIISHTPHYLKDSQIVGWGTVQEINQLATLFDQVHHVAVLYNETPPLSSLPYTASNITTIFVPPSGGNTLLAKLNIFKAWFHYWKIIRQEINLLQEEDILHIRCPANIGLLALLYIMCIRKIRRRWIKYAGNWKPVGNDPASYALQRWILKNNLTRSIVTINGSWQNQPEHILSFDNPSLYTEKLQKKTVKNFSSPFQLLYVGSMSEAKGVGRSVKAALELIEAGIELKMDLIGDGEMRTELELQVEQLNQQNHFQFHGWLALENIVPYYERAHFILLPSRSEGWPKVLSEAMAYGVVPLAGAVSSIPQVLKRCEAGVALNPLDVSAFAKAISTYINDPERWEIESQSAQRTAYQFTYETYLKNLKVYFAEKWRISL